MVCWGDSGPGGICTPHLHLRESPADVMLDSDVCLVCVHTEQQAADALAGDDGLLSIGSREMTDKVQTSCKRCGLCDAHVIYAMYAQVYYMRDAKEITFFVALDEVGLEFGASNR